MTPADAGPLAALVDRTDPYHRRAVRTVKSSPRRRYLVTWPCLTEAMHLAGRSRGHAGREAVWELVTQEGWTFHTPPPSHAARTRELMKQYKNVPMDLADASIIAAAEERFLADVFTFDTDFYVYRTADNRALRVVG